jgi:CubicO group peptidase (beta-lactamase class C family)
MSNPYKKYILIAILICFSLLLSCSQMAGNPQAAVAPITSGSISGIIERYRQEIPHQMERYHIPGLSIVIVDDQGLLWAEGFGFTDWNSKTPVTQSTLFSIQSMSKSFTATAVMFAAQDGLVDLDAPITNYLPDFHVNSIFEEHPEQKMTLRLLLSHTTGLVHEAPIGGNFDLPGHTFEQHIASISDTWLKFPVGTRYSYSNLGIDLAGYILQVRSGMPFAQYVQEKVLDPLGMQASTLDFDRARSTSGRAIGHDILPLSPPVEWLLIPSGGVWTTAEDMARYLLFHINKGAVDGNRLLREDLVEIMYTPPNLAAQGAYSDSEYALGIAVNLRHGARHFQHSGGGFGYNSSMVWYPELELGSVVLTNAIQPDGYYYNLSEAVLDDIIISEPGLYAQRAASAAQTAPAYPPDKKENILSDVALQKLIESKALPADEAASKRLQPSLGKYVLTKWGIPIVSGALSEANGNIILTSTAGSSSLIEVQPGLFFSPTGDASDVRQTSRTAPNTHWVKVNTQVLPLQAAFYAICGLVFLSTLLFWPVRLLMRRFRHKSPSVGADFARPSRTPWLVWISALAVLASLFSLFCLVMIARVPNLVYVPWPRPYQGLYGWQFALLGLPFMSLLLAVALGMAVVFSMRGKAWTRALSLYYGLVALSLLSFNLAILL